MGCHSLHQGIFLTQGSNTALLHCKQILYLYHLRPSEKLCLSINRSSNKGYHIVVCSCSYLHYFFSVQKNSSDIHLSFLILVMCFFFLSLSFFVLLIFVVLIRLEAYQFYWFFSKDWLLLLLIFSVGFLFLILFISALIFIMSSLLLTLHLICSSFSDFYKWKLRLFILLDLYFSLNNGFDAIHFHLSIDLLHLTNFDKFYFHLVQITSFSSVFFFVNINI